MPLTLKDVQQKERSLLSITPRYPKFLRLHLHPLVLLIKSIVNMKLSMEHWWSESDRAKEMYSQKNLSQYQHAHHKSLTV
jgi:hypothetical protein